MFAQKKQWFDLTFAWIVLRLTICMSQGMDDISGEKVFVNSGTPESPFVVIGITGWFKKREVIWLRSDGKLTGAFSSFCKIQKNYSS